MNLIREASERDRILELQADRALCGLDGVQAAELDTLHARYPEMDTDAMDLAAAALDLAILGQGDVLPLPEHLRDRLLPQNPESRQARPNRFGGSRLGWFVAAACVVWIVSARWFGAAPSVESQYDQLVVRASDLMRAEWQATEDPAAQSLSGELTWSNQEQRGFIRLRDLELNDREALQYQLWIFDRSQEHPVDGGVFDSNGEDLLIPIDAKIGVAEPWQFAITVEKPGGVVVSQQERVVALAVP